MARTELLHRNNFNFPTGIGSEISGSLLRGRSIDVSTGWVPSWGSGSGRTVLFRVVAT
jgi:hypothetical protein